ncbi:MAG: hypothetical protein HZB39_08110 [Planctomycetes bacterium]|nr:hypothetical protein [Planctomycetota bacterium]
MRFLLASACLTVVSTVAIQDPAPTPAKANPLAVFAPLIGRDWVGVFPDGKLSDTQRYEWVYGAKFVRNTHQVRVADGTAVYEGETIYAWDARAERITWLYWNTSGGYVAGTVTVRDDGVLIVEGDNHGPKEQLDQVKAEVRIGDGEWSMRPGKAKDGKWSFEEPRAYRAKT